MIEKQRPDRRIKPPPTRILTLSRRLENINLEVECDAVKCVYNEDRRCAAERIDIAGDGACECGQTRCATFKAR